MKTLKKIAWRIYNKITHYEQEIIDEFEFQLWKELEEKYYDLQKKKREAIDGHSTDGEQNESWFNDWLNGCATGETIAYHCVWNNIYDRFHAICVRTGRVDEFKRLKEKR